MDYQAISLEFSDGVALLTLKRPEKMNALNAQMRAEITHAVNDLALTGQTRGVRVLVLTGEGNAVCSGQDLGDGGSAATLDLERTLRDEYTPMIRAIMECPIPTISAVNGAAAGAGANLALSADVVIATESAFFIQAFSRIGLMPDAGGTYMLPRQMGMAKAMGAALFADKITAKQADDWGMIWEHVPDKDFETHWKARAAHLANGPTAAYARIKQALHKSWDNDLNEQLAEEAKLQGACGKTRDFQEGVVAFLEKRPARYEGR
jgi:2-(1,2-epoxy-1,2-dihydrophenyl)acetyl-CoA isomerase